ncbi:MAG TPA: M23 family metallopeptidase [Candidatus Binatia bacterium]|nr:M23 family metallopeptidase [Candidatus Binatia bacterium]
MSAVRSAAILTAAAVAGLSLLGGAEVGALSSQPFVKPVNGATISQPFGCTSFAAEPVDPSCPGGHFHSGIDLAVAAGTPVHATLAGSCQVIDDRTGYGLHVVIDHGSGLTSLYAHLEAVSVHNGEPVSAGQRIGLVGSTGNSTGPHLHFEIRIDGVAQDPQLFVHLP